MANTVINFPGIPTGLTLTTDVCNPTSLAVEETVTLTEASGIYSGVVAGAVSGQKVFVLKASGTRFGTRVRTIADTVGPFTIVSELDQLADDGRGEHAVTITVNDGATGIVGAVVKCTKTGVYGTATTVTGGIAKLALVNGTYDVVISASGYETLTDTLVVSGASADTYSLTERTIASSDAGTATGWTYVYDEVLAIEADVDVSIQMIAGPGDDGRVLDTKIRTVASDEDGYVEFTNLLYEAEYRIWRGGAAEAETSEGFTVRGSTTSGTFVVPDAVDSFAMAEVLGIDAEA